LKQLNGSYASFINQLLGNAQQYIIALHVVFVENYIFFVLSHEILS